MAKQQTPYPAPAFKLKNQDGKTVSLNDYNDKWLVLYFYPKDETAGCTAEACSFRDSRDDIAEQTGAAVVGISMDSTDSHAQFSKNHRLNFPLLSDPEGSVIKAYGAWGPTMYGRVGILRKTFLIDPGGMVAKVYGRVTPLMHAEKVLGDLKSLQN